MSAPVRVAIVSPHRDDAAFSCGVLIAALLCAGADVTIANIFTISDYTLLPERFARETRNDQIAAITAERRREDELFVQRARAEGRGTLHLRDLHWEDAPLRIGIAAEQVLLSPLPPEEMRQQARRLARELEFLQEFDVVLAPLALGGHIDHRLARDAAEQAVVPGKLALYEDLPYAARITPPERDAMANPAENPSSHQDLTRHTIRMPRAAHLKTQFALTYSSQIAPKVAMDIGAFSASLGDGERWYSDTICGTRLAEALHQVATITRDDG